MGIPLDDHGQPLSLSLNYPRRVNRATNELIGFLRGIIADGRVSPEECEQLAKWVVANSEITDLWPINILVQRIERIYNDGIADEEERAELARAGKPDCRTAA